MSDHQWRINAPPVVLKQIQGMFREMGQFGQNHDLTVKDLAATKWKQPAKQVLDALLKRLRRRFLAAV